MKLKSKEWCVKCEKFKGEVTRYVNHPERYSEEFNLKEKKRMESEYIAIICKQCTDAIKKKIKNLIITM